MIPNLKLSRKQKQTVRRNARTPLGIVAIVLLLTGMSFLKQPAHQSTSIDESHSFENQIVKTQPVESEPANELRHKQDAPSWSPDGPAHQTVIR